MKPKLKDYKHTVDKLTPAIVKKRFEKYFGPPNEKVMKKVKTFAEKLRKAKVGSIFEKDRFEIEKINSYTYDFNYYKMTNQGFPMKFNFLTIDDSALERTLYDIAMGIVEWDDNTPIRINPLMFN